MIVHTLTPVNLMVFTMHVERLSMEMPILYLDSNDGLRGFQNAQTSLLSYKDQLD